MAAERKPRVAPAGVWLRERQCGDCGQVDRVGRARTQAPLMLASVQPGPACRGYYNGRPGNRCGWPTSWAWIFVPTGGARLG